MSQPVSSIKSASSSTSSSNKIRPPPPGLAKKTFFAKTWPISTEPTITGKINRTALILGRSNGVGLDKDAALLNAALTQAGLSTRAPGLKSLSALFSNQYRADIAFHLERVAPWWKRKSLIHCLLPNQERFPQRLLPRLGMIDHILCKTHHAQEIFSKHHPSVRYIGFTSEDRCNQAEPDYSRFLHLAGKSTLKNTGLLLELWEKHPEWPTLTLVQHPDNAPAKVPANVELISRYLPDDELKNLQNTCGIHLCPSLSEGWGHYIAEAMSCRAVTLVTDAPPMNELVSPERGVTVPFHRTEARHLGINFHADPSALEDSIDKLIALDTTEKIRIGQAAREWFLNNDQAFTSRISQLAGDL